jgi:MFS transporter, DHA1 family, inner membrane transport protein
MPRKELIILLTLAFVQFSNILDGMILMPLAPTIKTVFLIDTQHFGWLVSSFGISAGCSAFFSTFWADKFDRKKILIILYIGFIIGTFFCAIAPNYQLFLLARVFTGIFGGVCGSVILAIVGDIIPNERRASAMGMIMMGFALAAVAGIPLGLILSNKFGWQMPFYVICGIGFIVLLSIIVFIPNVNSHLKAENKTTYKQFYSTLFSNSSMQIALCVPVIMTVAHMGIIPYITDFTVNNLHFNKKTDVPLMYLIGGLLSVVNSPLVGKLADKFGRYKLFSILSLLAVIPLFLITNANSSSVVLFLCFSSMFFIFSGGRMVPVQAMITSAVLPQFIGSFMALNSALQQFTLGIVTFVGGTIITNNATGELLHYNIVGYIAIGATILSVLIAKKIKQVA